MSIEFSEMNLHPLLVQAVTDLGYTSPMPIQSELIPVMMTGQDVIGQAQTGTGKTAAFALPILHNIVPSEGFVQALVMTPTRELALQVAEAIGGLGKTMNVRVLTVYGGAPYGPQIHGLRRGVEVVVGTPGRIMDLLDRSVLDISHVRTVVLDEADEMLSMGFIEDIESILSKTPTERQTALFSATMPTEIRRLAEKYLRSPQQISIKRKQVTVETIEQRYYIVNNDDKLAALSRLFEMEEITSALIFARTRTSTAELAAALTQRGYPAEVLNGDLSQDARESTLNRFRQNQIKVLVATDVAARGLDIDDISHVFNYDLPDDFEIYVHRIGRTGRAGKKGIAITLATPYERRRILQIESFIRSKINRAELPTDEDIRKGREDRLIGQVNIWLTRNRFKREREMVEQLVAEGHDPIDIAAAALKVARAEEKQRPMAPIGSLVEPQPVQTYRKQRMQSTDRMPYTRSESSSHEPGMVRIRLNMGKSQGLRVNDVVGVIAFHAAIPGHMIGKIFIQEDRSLVDVPEQFAHQVLAKSGEIQFHRQPLELQRA
jgi:ATP-dependent RNA helicase DeaD